MTITTLLEHPDLWRAGRPGGGGSHRPVEPSRYPLLDQHLTGGGWPVGSVCELCFNQTGIGELRLLAPALASLSRQQRWIAWVNPPFLPYPPALAASGIQVGRMLLIRQPGPGSCPERKIPERKIPERQNQGERFQDERLQGERLQGERLQGERLQGERLQGERLEGERLEGESPWKESYPQKRQNDPRLKAHRRMLWALEQASRSGACSAVLAWLDERLVTVRDLQRLQVAARQGNTLTWLFRPGTALQQPSLASLRLQLHAAQSPGAGLQRLRIDIVKRQGGWPVEGLVLDLQDNPGQTNRRQVTDLLTFWRSEQHRPALPPDPAHPFSIPAAVQQRALH